MSKVSWTSDQQKVIDLRNRNILVSAAAGSGKTAVLVERIITMITDETHPVDIDHLLIVTFTNAAASEMRDRISKAVEEKLKEDPDSVNLQKQMALIHSAQITTIHSFCLYVIRNYFNTIDLDPSFRIAEEAELKLLQSDVVAQLLEKSYEELEENFVELVECYATGKSDDSLESLILQLYHFSVSYPWPLEWLEEMRKAFQVTTLEELEEARWMEQLKEYIAFMLEDLCAEIEDAVSICLEPDGPYMYEANLQEEKKMLSDIANVDTYEGLMEAFERVEFKRLPGKKDASVDADKKEMVKKKRDRIKKVLSDMKENYFFQPVEEMLADIHGAKPSIDALIDLTIQFTKEYAQLKEERGIVDFNDLEHLALNILVDRDCEQDTVTPTNVAIELSEYYEELLIDEYQDSNLVQETILSNISKEKMGRPNVFMVGDVKQSIYKFRMARPELFMEKYHTYSTEDSLKQRIDLHKNFRSRDVVLSPVNYIFKKIMIPKLGKIKYDDNAALHVGANYPNVSGSSTSTELVLVGEINELTDADKEELERKAAELGYEAELVESESHGSGTTLNDFTTKELEAKAVAAKIKELTHPEHGLKVMTKEKDEEGNPVFRTARLSDIVILFRSMSGWSDVFVDVLMSEGINAYADTQSGYFSTIEIRTILNVLKVLDNPRQEIPLAAVLHSPIFDVTSEELAKLKIHGRKKELYDNVISYARGHLEETVEETFLVDPQEEPEEILWEAEPVAKIPKECIEEDDVLDKQGCEEEKDEELVEKLERFLSFFEAFRSIINYTPIYELIQKIVEDTNYYYYVQAMPAGERRVANIDMLVQRAIDFESTSFSGLFDFNRYIEKLEKYEIDYGEASVSNESDDAVRIMSIHKSKGLEFPICIVAGMGKAMNNQDARSRLVLHADLGLGPDYIDKKYRIKSPTLMKKVIQKTVVLENQAEELRILYVALTRAKEKLIMTGYVKNFADRIKSFAEPQSKAETLSYQKLTSASSYLDWVIEATRLHPEFLHRTYLALDEEELAQFALKQEVELQKNVPYHVEFVDVLRLVHAEVEGAIKRELNKEELQQFDADAIYDQEIREEMITHLEYEYPYLADTTIHSKVTVSELKKLSQYSEEEDSVPLTEIEPIALEEVEIDKTIPNFIREQKEEEGKPILKATELGTLYHRVLEKIDFATIETKEELIRGFEALVIRQIIEPEEMELIESDKIYHLLDSPLGKRMKEAARRKALKREQQFVLGQPATTIHAKYQSEEMILVQGIIDAYFEEDGKLILVDYKTDHVENGKQLIKRYKTQLSYYKRALEQMTHKQVNEIYIYSLVLEKGIEVKF